MYLNMRNEIETVSPLLPPDIQIKKASAAFY